MVVVPETGDRFGETEPGLRTAPTCLIPPRGTGFTGPERLRILAQSGEAGDRSGRIFTYVIGAGHFGARAARLTSKDGKGPVVVVDRELQGLEEIRHLPVQRVRADGIDFLVGRFEDLAEKDLIIPAVPLHLAYLWLKATLRGQFDLEQSPVPESLKETLPHTWAGSEGSLLVSYADFLCPDDCPEPDACTVTGERRRPLYELLGELTAWGRKALVLRSRQVAPGVGGYRAGDLKALKHALVSGGEGHRLLATACKCHGIVTAFRFVAHKAAPAGPGPQDKEKTCS